MTAARAVHTGCAALVCALFCCCLWPVGTVTAAAITVEFSLIMRNSSFPTLGEEWHGTVVYDSVPDPQRPFVNYPLGYPILDMTGTRTVWTATADEPDVYRWNSTANILGMVRAYNQQYWFINSSVPLLPGNQQTEVAPGGLSNDTVYGSLYVFASNNLTNYTTADGWQLYPLEDNIYNNLFYLPSEVRDSMDNWGWLISLDRPQPGMVNVTATAPLASYLYTVNLYSADGGIGAVPGHPTASGDIADWVSDQDPATDLLAWGFNGNISISPAVTPGGVLGDPSFTGLLGQSYQVHGIDGAVYNLVSSRDLQVNALFSFLSSGQCPVLPGGERDSNCWSHPGSYLGAIGLQHRVADDTQQLQRLHRLSVQSGSYITGFSSVVLDGVELTAGTRYSDAAFAVSYLSSHRLEVSTAQFQFVLTNSDHFINQAVAPLVPLPLLTGTHGLLGQTHCTKRYATLLKHIEGDVDDYVIAERALFGHQFLFNRFEASTAA